MVGAATGPRVGQKEAGGGRTIGHFNENVYVSIERLLDEYNIHRDLTSIRRDFTSIHRDLTTNRSQAPDLQGCVTHWQTRKMESN